jgi:hypothetical protein
LKFQTICSQTTTLRPYLCLWILFFILFVNLPVRAESCKSLPPLPANPEKQDWNHTRSSALTQWSGKPNHRLQDGIFNTDTRPWLIGKFAYGFFDKDLKGEQVALFVHKNENCQAWQPLGKHTTSKDETEEVTEGIGNDGGRIFFQLEPLPMGVYPVRARVSVDKSLATGTLYVMEKDTPVVIFDIDGTLTRSDRELTSQLLSKISKGAYVPRMRPGTKSLAWEWFRHGVLPIYITGRPDTLHRITRTWLQQQGFPPGPIVLATRLRDAKPTTRGVGHFKRQQLERLVKTLELHIVAAYGNASTDRFAYKEAGIPAEEVFLFGEHPLSGPYQLLGDLSAHILSVQRLSRLEHANGWPRFWY